MANAPAKLRANAQRSGPAPPNPPTVACNRLLAGTTPASWSRTCVLMAGSIFGVCADRVLGVCPTPLSRGSLDLFRVRPVLHVRVTEPTALTTLVRNLEVCHMTPTSNSEQEATRKGRYFELDPNTSAVVTEPFAIDLPPPRVAIHLPRLAEQATCPTILRPTPLVMRH